jgi:hypothetical protein
MRIVRILALSTLLLSLAMPGLGRATTAFPVTVEGLTRVSDTVVRGKVLSRESRWSGDRKLIFTFVRLQILEVWSGSAPAEVTIRVPGGVAGDYGQMVDGAPSFEVGEEVVVFLQTGPNVQVSGLAQGKFQVDKGQAKSNLNRMQVLERALPTGERRSESMSVTELRQRVRSAR